MNLILLRPADFEAGHPDRVALRGRRLEHVRSVHRAVVGDRLWVGLLGGRIGRGTVETLTREVLEMSVVLDSDPPRALAVTLVLALPRPPVLKRTLIAATSLGVKRIALIHSRRVEKSFWGSTAATDESIEGQLELGLEQARDTILPEVTKHRRFRPFAEDTLPALADGTLGLVAHPQCATECPRGVAGPVTLVVGPEGGFVDYEIERLEAAGLAPVHIPGDRVLRVESAVPYLIARVS